MTRCPYCARPLAEHEDVSRLYVGLRAWTCDDSPSGVAFAQTTEEDR